MAIVYSTTRFGPYGPTECCIYCLLLATSAFNRRVNHKWFLDFHRMIFTTLDRVKTVAGSTSFQLLEGTVFFNQKKLNLGPAIRQKCGLKLSCNRDSCPRYDSIHYPTPTLTFRCPGVVFNAAQEAANEPVTSAGVYIHPSGYCYTVAPNGVWYFHDGGSPEDTPSQTPVPHTPVAHTQLSQPQMTQPSMPGPEMSLPTSQGNSLPVQISAPNVAHVPPAIPAQLPDRILVLIFYMRNAGIEECGTFWFIESPPAVVPMKLIPADQLPQQNCPVYTHYIVPQNVALPNTNTPDPASRFYSDGNVMPYYVAQAQPQLPQMSVYPITSLQSQVHAVPPPSVHIIPGQFARQPYPAPPRPEVYQIYSAPYDPSIIEHGPFIRQNNKTISSSMFKQGMIRPPAPLKRMTVELPPQRNHFRRNGDFLSHNPNGNGFRVSTGSGGSTPASSSSSSGGENYPDQKEDSL
eukprot:gene14450-5510_t